MLKKILFVTSLIFSIVANCQYYNLSDNAKVSVLTCGSGNELYSIYGHTAIRVIDQAHQLDMVYNYGNFDFATENFYLKFVKGDLQYFVAACSFQDFMYEYVASDRTVFEQQLQLSTHHKQLLFEQLNAEIVSDGRFYTYKFIDKNFTTMVLDKINNLFGKQTIIKKHGTNSSYRTILYGYLNNHFWENFGINIIFGREVDQLATKLFLPNELLLNIKTARFNNKPISAKTIILNKQKTELAKSCSFYNSIYFYILLLLIVVVINQYYVTLAYFILVGTIGVFFSTVGFYSFHQEIGYNYNIGIFNPSLLLLSYFILNKNKKWIINLCYFNLFSIGIYALVLSNKVHLLMMAPMIMTSIILILRIIVTQKTLLPSIK